MTKPKTDAAHRNTVEQLVWCGSCRHFERGDYDYNYGGIVGSCRRYPPRLTSTDGSWTFFENWNSPVVTADGDWCGEHTPNAGVSRKERQD